MPYTQPYNLAIPSGVKQNGADCWAVLDPDSGGANTFSVPLSANGQLPATHWACRTILEQETYDALTTMTTTQFKDYVNALAGTRGRGQVSGASFKNSLLMAEGDFNAFLAANGLQRIVAAP